jgi:DNA polymerase III alpha subunit
MCILHRLGGIDLESAYVCIKDISKKKMECVDRFEKEFVLGCLDRVCPKAVAHEVFEIITRFGGYGVCKAFTLANALVSYQMAYIKAHHPAEFSEALLSDHDASDALHELSASNPELLLRYRELITRYSSHDVEVIRNLLPGDEVFIGGKVTNVRTQRMEGTRKGEGPRYAVFRLEDFSGSIECVIWPNTFARNESQLVNDYVYFVGGVVEHLCTERSLLVTKLMTPEAVHHKRTRRRGSN